MGASRRHPVDFGALSPLSREMAAAITSVASDLALVVDEDGIVLSVSAAAAALGAETAGWVGRRWSDTVTEATRRKIELMMGELAEGGIARRREVNLTVPSGADLPVAYAAVRLGRHGPILVAGRDLRVVAAIQQRFVDAQHEMERQYWKVRHSESRYRMLFEVATDAVMVVESESMHVIDANRVALELFGLPRESIVGNLVTLGIHSVSRGAVEELLHATRTSGRPAEIKVQVTGKAAVLYLSATPFRGDDSLLLLIKLRQNDTRNQHDEHSPRLIDFVEQTLDPIVVTDSQGRLQSANPAFVKMLRASTESELLGKSLADWLGDTELETPRALAEVRRRGIAPAWVTVVRISPSDRVSVEVSATLLTDGDQESIGFTMRTLGRSVATGDAETEQLAPIFADLLARLGQSNLQQLMREANDRVERFLVLAAVARHNGDLEQSARLLGVEPDSLSLRLRRMAPSRGPGR